MMRLHLRPATMDDASILLQWRNDESTRMASRNQEVVAEAEHLEWLKRSFADDNRKILIAEVDGQPVGTIRLDQNDEDSTEVSWTVAPSSRGKGIGKAIVRAAIAGTSGKLIAYVREENIASQKIATTVGFERAEHQLNELVLFELQN